MKKNREIFSVLTKRNIENQKLRDASEDLKKLDKLDTIKKK